MINNKAKIFLSIAIVIGIFGFWFSYSDFKSKELSIKEKELRIKEETYISVLLEQYNRDLQGCFSAVEKSESLTRNLCIENINNSRVGKLLKEWGYMDLLMSKE